MRKSIFILTALAAGHVLAAGEAPAREALEAFGGPMQQIVSEAAKGDRADLTTIAGHHAEAKTAWFKLTAKPLDLDQYGVPADQQEEVWRQVRTMGMLVGYIDEAVQRGDRATVLLSAKLLAPAYQKVSAALNGHPK